MNVGACVCLGQASMCVWVSFMYVCACALFFVYACARVRESNSVCVYVYNE